MSRSGHGDRVGAKVPTDQHAPTSKSTAIELDDVMLAPYLSRPGVGAELDFLRRVFQSKQFRLIESVADLGRGPRGPVLASGEPLHGAWVAAELGVGRQWHVSVVANNGWLIDLARHPRPSPHFDALRPLNFALAWAGWASGTAYIDGNDLALERVIASRKPATVARVLSEGQLWRLQERARNAAVESDSWLDDSAGHWWFAAARPEPLASLAQLDQLGDYLRSVAPDEMESVNRGIGALEHRSAEDYLDRTLQRRLWDVAHGDDVARKVEQCAVLGYWPPVTAGFMPSVQRMMTGLDQVQSSRIKDHIPALWDLGYAAFLPLKKRAEDADAKPERNGPCPCGSGQKFKKCHSRS